MRLFVRMEKRRDMRRPAGDGGGSLHDNPMKRILICSAILSAAIVAGAGGFWLGKRQGEAGAFEKGVTVGHLRSALIRGGHANLHTILIESGKTVQLKDHIVDEMWVSVVPLDQLLNSPDASEEDRKRVGNVLPRLVEYFYLNPMAITEAPRDRLVSESIDKGFQEKAGSTTDPTKKDTLDAVHEASKGITEELDGMFDAILSARRKFDLETQEVINRHVSQRNFPGSKRVVAGVTWMLPSAGRQSGSSKRIRVESEKVQILYESGVLRVNGRDFGSVSKGDVVDLRMLGRVFVNDAERLPVER